MVAKLLFSIYVIYCFEVGIFLVVFPWMDFWKQHVLLQHFPSMQLIVLNNFFRGAVSGLGLANIILGAWEIANFRNYFKKA
jgi:hypothetical protein